LEPENCSSQLYQLAVDLGSHRGRPLPSKIGYPLPPQLDERVVVEIAFDGGQIMGALVTPSSADAPEG